MGGSQLCLSLLSCFFAHPEVKITVPSTGTVTPSAGCIPAQVLWDPRVSGTVCGREAHAAGFVPPLCPWEQRLVERLGGSTRGYRPYVQGWCAFIWCKALLANTSFEETCKFEITSGREGHYGFCVLLWQLKKESEGSCQQQTQFTLELCQNSSMTWDYGSHLLKDKKF